MNLPNKITTLRIILIPIMIFFYLADFIPYGKLISLGVFIIAACTDFIDGYIARSRNMVTNLGKFLDPIADKLLANSALLLVVVGKTVPMPYGVLAAIIIIGRDLIVGALRQIAATNNIVISADWWGKVKFNFQAVGVGGFMLLAQIYTSNWLAGTTWLTVLEVFCYVIMGIAVLLTIYSGFNYVLKNKKVLKG